MKFYHRPCDNYAYIFMPYKDSYRIIVNKKDSNMGTYGSYWQSPDYWKDLKEITLVEFLTNIHIDKWIENNPIHIPYIKSYIEELLK